NGVETTFHSFWGQFGWMAIPMPVNVYRGFVLFVLGVLIGAGLFAWRQHWPRALDGPQRDALIVLTVTAVFVFAAFVLYNRDFVQFQGRYLFPALVPLAALVAVGLTGWITLVPARFSARFPVVNWLPVAALMGLAVFAWYALDTYIVPNLRSW
ncbi:MAG: hypothetical protein JXQ72_16895, partial [Anaerolineae bacterium]|nr:hypothetical protein [Anaerolineae bacterium]